MEHPRTSRIHPLLKLAAIAAIGSTLSLAVTSTSMAGGLTSPSVFEPYLGGVFSDNQSTGSSEGWKQKNYFPDVNFVEPIRIVEHPIDNKLLVVSKNGKGHLITNREGASDKTEFFNIQPIMQGNPSYGEGGISDFVFHPEFGRGGRNDAYVYITYWFSPDFSGTFSDFGENGYNRLSRFEVINNKVSLDTELVMISQYDRDKFHIAGDMEFGPDGFLYITVGDETNGASKCCDIRDSTQSLNGGFWSGVLRIDVDNDPSRSHPIRRQPLHPATSPQVNGSHWPESFTQGYSIPNDNPFLDASGGLLEEFFAIGLRHPWTLSIDDVTGDVWVADVGHQQREEINLIVNGGNYQWPYKEGTRSGTIPDHKLAAGSEQGPVWEYDSSVGESPIGAGVYRGNLYPALIGKYIFTDFVSGKLWTATKVGSSYTVEQIGNVTGGWGTGINSHLIDSRGRILMAKSAGPQDADGTIETLVPAEGIANNEPPALLSQVGAFSDLTDKIPIEGCIPYDLNVPFWSDGAVKSRWVCVPNDGSHDSADERISYSEQGIWSFPVGTVFIKHFEMAADTTDPSNTFDLETRFLVRTASGYNAYTYRWNSTGTDADLDTGGGSTFNFSQRTENGNRNRQWEYPSRTECMICHNQQAGGQLGINTRQLNRELTYPSSGITANQLDTFSSLSMLSPAIDASSVIATTLTATPTADTSASLEDRARSYLDSNCGYCHQPGGVRASFDARLTTPLTNQGIVNGSLLEHYGIEGEAVVVPGSPAQSILFHRANQTDNLSMPPLSKSIIDEPGMAVLEQWIVSLAPDNDSDDDGIVDTQDSFPLDPLNDIDGDLISGHIDNCPEDSNADQIDGNNNGVGDVCDTVVESQSSPVTTVQLQNDATGLCIEIESASQAINANAQSGACSDESHQQLSLQPVQETSGLFNLVFAHSSQCLTVPQDTVGNGPSLVQSPCSGAHGQQFELFENDGSYSVLTGTGDGDHLVDSHAQTNDIIQWEDYGRPNQRWQLTEVSTQSDALVVTTSGFSTPGTSGGGTSGAGLLFLPALFSLIRRIRVDYRKRPTSSAQTFNITHLPILAELASFYRADFHAVRVARQRTARRGEFS